MGTYFCSKGVVHDADLSQRGQCAHCRIAELESQYHAKELEYIGEVKAKLKAEAERDAAKEEARQMFVNASFFRSCALGGEVPEKGDEPYPLDTGE